MAKPLFAKNKNELIAKLRLTSEVSSTSEAVLNEALLQVRVAIYRFLGEARVSAIAATAYSESATSELGITRLNAAQTELYGVKARLLRDAPAFFMEAKNSAEEVWNNDDLLRNANTEEEAIAYYENLFAEGLYTLQATPEDSPKVRAKTVTPNNNAQKVIGQSLTSGKGLSGLWP